MTADENLRYLDDQVAAYRAVESELTQAVEIGVRAQEAAAVRIRELRSEIRALRETVVAAPATPSVADIERRLRIETRIHGLEQVETFIGELVNRLRDIRDDLRITEEELLALPQDGLSADDAGRLTALEESFIDQLQEYRFSSFPIDALRVSRETYRPEREGFDLGFDLSASDGVRVVWAYLLGLLEVARTWSTNHPGFLIFDEPRQQSASEYSLAALLRRSAGAGEAGQQILFASSESLESLVPMLEGLDHQLIRIDGRLLKPNPNAFDPGHGQS